MAAKAEVPEVPITKEQLLADYKQHFDRIREELTGEYMKQIIPKIENDMYMIVKQCIEFLEHHKIGLHDCEVLTDKHYCGQALLILEKIYGVTKIKCSYEFDEHYSGLQRRTSVFRLVFGPKVGPKVDQ